MKRIVFSLFLVGFAQLLAAQELRCNISVNSSKVTGANRELFQSMQMDLYEFMNNRKWTKHNYRNDERIECSMNIQINRQISSDEYDATIMVQSSRPVFNTSYRTTMLNVKDESFRFRYKEFQPLEFVENNNKENLTSVLAYYAYVVIGYDYDSFSPEGGSEYFEKAKSIVNNSQNATEKGWKAFESDYNRYWLVENMLNKNYAPYRQCLYRFHRKGLDAMAESPEAGRTEIADSLRDLQRVFRAKARLYITNVFLDAKREELINIFSQSYPDELNRVVVLLSEIDPSNAERYQKLKEKASN
jgi:hypothetical protein